MKRYFAVRRSDSLQSPAIFTSWDDCCLHVDLHKKDGTVEFRFFTTIQEAADYIDAQEEEEEEEEESVEVAQSNDDSDDDNSDSTATHSETSKDEIEDSDDGSSSLEEGDVETDIIKKSKRSSCIEFINSEIPNMQQQTQQQKQQQQSTHQDGRNSSTSAEAMKTNAPSNATEANENNFASDDNRITTTTKRYHALKECATLQSAAIFTSLDDCSVHIELGKRFGKIDYALFATVLEAVDYIEKDEEESSSAQKNGYEVDVNGNNVNESNTQALARTTTTTTVTNTHQRLESSSRSQKKKATPGLLEQDFEAASVGASSSVEPPARSQAAEPSGKEIMNMSTDKLLNKVGTTCTAESETRLLPTSIPKASSRKRPPPMSASLLAPSKKRAATESEASEPESDSDDDTLSVEVCNNSRTCSAAATEAMKTTIPSKPLQVIKISNDNEKKAEKTSIPYSEWDRHFDLLQEYKKIHGHCRIGRYKPGKMTCKKFHVLYDWLQKQKQQKKDMLADSTWEELLQQQQQHVNNQDDNNGVREKIEQLQLLDALMGPEKFDLSEEENWHRSYRLLKKYKEEKDHVHPLLSENRELYNFVRKMKNHITKYKEDIETYKKGHNVFALDENKFRKLTEELGLTENHKPKLRLSHDDAPTWNDMFERLCAFREEHGHLEVPHAPRSQLRNWVDLQKKHFQHLKEDERNPNVRRKYKKETMLTPERIAKLAGIGFSFKSKLVKVPFNERAVAWLQYFKKYGRDPPRADSALGVWVVTMRQHYKKYKRGEHQPMTKEQFDKLESWGFVLETNRKKPEKLTPMKSWDERYAELVDYKNKNGNTTNLRQKGNVLGGWADTQRKEYARMKKGKKSAMTPYKIKKLQEIDFVFARRIRTCRKRPPAEKPVEEPAEDSTEEPAKESAVKEVAEEPVEELVEQPAEQPPLQPALTPALLPALDPALLPALLPALQPAHLPALQPVLQPALEPAMEPVSIRFLNNHAHF